MRRMLIDASNIMKNLSAQVVTNDLFGMGIQEGLNRAMNIISSEPFVDAEPIVYGEWIKCVTGLGNHECSVCGVPAPIDDWDDSILSKRCPSCGAQLY